MLSDESLLRALERVEAIFPATKLIDLSERNPCSLIASKKVRSAVSALVARQYEPHQFPKLAAAAYRALLLVCALNDPVAAQRLERLDIDPDDPLYGLARSSALGGLMFEDARDIYLSWALTDRIMLTVDGDREIRDQGDFVLFAGIALIYMAHHKQHENLPEAFDLLAVGIEVLAANDEFLYLAAADALEEAREQQEASGKASDAVRARRKKEAKALGFSSHDEMIDKAVADYYSLKATYPNWKEDALKSQIASLYKVSQRTISRWLKQANENDAT